MISILQGRWLVAITSESPALPGNRAITSTNKDKQLSIAATIQTTTTDMEVCKLASYNTTKTTKQGVSGEMAYRGYDEPLVGQGMVFDLSVLKTIILSARLIQIW